VNVLHACGSKTTSRLDFQSGSRLIFRGKGVLQLLSRVTELVYRFR